MSGKLVAAGLCAMVLASCALAATAPKSPLALVLRPGDFPAKADPVDAGPMPASFQRKLEGIRAVGKGARYFANIPFGPERAQTVSGLVVVAATPAHARTIYAWQKRTAMRPGRASDPLRLPRYGDAQVAYASGKTDTAHLLVRKNSVVWRIEIGAGGALTLSPARLRVELAKYAEKQERRVGKG